jgi:apolipoprotein N-acyltransferase
MKSFAHHVMLSWGIRRVLLAMLAGAVGALALPPFNLLPALAVSLTIAVWLIDGASGGTSRWSLATLRAAAWTGWCFGFGYFVAGLWWLGSAFLVEPDQFALLMPLGVLGLPAGLAFFPALGFVLARLLWSAGPARVFALTFGLSATEWLRGHVLTGFPWNDFGMALGTHLVFAQTASLIGLYGLTLVAVFVGAAPATLATERAGSARWRLPVVALAVLGAMAVFGTVRLALGDVGLAKGVKLRIVQPDIPQDDKFRPENRDAIMARYLTLSDRAASPERSGIADVTHLFWPESAFPFVLARDPQALAQIAALLPPGVRLITGAVRPADALPGDASRRFYNAIQVVGDDGTVLDSADKTHLVPFGEYLPFSDVLTSLGLRRFVNAPGGFESGARRKMLNVPGLPPVAPLICYEAIFPGEVRPVEGVPGLLVNVTNDAWFGLTPGPYQHFAQARLRAVEEGLPLVRAANNGISAVVDPYGRIVASLALGQVGTVDSSLPNPIGITTYTRFGDVTFAFLLVMTFVACLIGRRSV